jgi:GNAT superfamily N-acetyltransferase
VTHAGAIRFHPVTRERWPDLERLFSESAGEALGNPSRCWCMEWRLESHQQWREQGAAANREGMRRFVESGEVPGILAYIDGEPAGWCSVSPRPTLVGMRSMGEFRRFGDPSVWSVICFYVPEKHRGIGMMRRLLEEAMRYAIEKGASIVEGYPFVPEKADDGAGGTTTIFEQAGFVKVKELLPGQFTMRHYSQER